MFLETAAYNCLVHFEVFFVMKLWLPRASSQGELERMQKGRKSGSQKVAAIIQDLQLSSGYSSISRAFGLA